MASWISWASETTLFLVMLFSVTSLEFDFEVLRLA
jgi:hypothetical protein